MKDTLLVGLQVTKKIKINRERTIGFMGEKGRVYGTPSMVEDIEYTCHELIQSHLDENENSVGTHVSVDHLGAPLGLLAQQSVLNGTHGEPASHEELKD